MYFLAIETTRRKLDCTIFSLARRPSIKRRRKRMSGISTKAAHSLLSGSRPLSLSN